MVTSKFQIGDRVVRINTRNGNLNVDDTGVVEKIQYEGGSFMITVRADKDGSSGPDRHDECNLQLISSVNNKNMNLIEKAKLAFKKEPEKSFIKAGVTDSNENFTTEGKELFLTYLLQKNKDDFKTTVIDSILAEEEAKTTK